MRISDWSSDVCSSDLWPRRNLAAAEHLAYASDYGRLDGNEDAVSVSISRVNEPMFAAKRRKSGHADWIVLVLSATILWMHDCRFCWRNAVRNEIKHHPQIGRASGRERGGQYG